jgi:hypothetical protein
MSKRCNTCFVEKPLDSFYRHKKGLLGRAPLCKDCYRPKRREIYEKTKHHYQPGGKYYYYQKKE